MIIYSDMHWFGAHSSINEPLIFGEDIFYIGDNVDLKNCPTQHLNEAKKLMHYIQKNAGTNYVPGNHELSYGDQTFIKYHRVLLTHGDIFFWPHKKIVRWRGGELSAGISPLMWYVFRLKNYVKDLWSIPINTKHFKKIYQTAIAPAYQCHTVIIGHEHPHRIVKIPYSINDGPEINIYVLPRGKHVLNIKVS
jgi:hypothetical protein